MSNLRLGYISKSIQGSLKAFEHDSVWNFGIPLNEIDANKIQTKHISYHQLGELCLMVADYYSYNHEAEERVIVDYWLDGPAAAAAWSSLSSSSLTPYISCSTLYKTANSPVTFS